ncbi:MAG: hypothetical protein IH624_16520 [Phycisphaerae bacterium]|nr:hypothetical protein [Phycisphaerae bacterium]
MTQTGGRIRRMFRIREVFAHRAVWLAVAGLSCWVLYGQIGRWVVRPTALRQMRQLCGDQVSIGSVHFRGGRHITCRDVTISAGEGSAYDRQMIYAREVRGRLSLWSLVRFQPRFKRIILTEVHVNAQYDIDRRTINLAGLIGSASADRKFALPIIAIEGGVLRISSVTGGTTQTHTILGLDGRIAPAPGGGGDYSFYLKANESLAFGGSFLRGTWQGARRRIRLSEGCILMGQSPVLGNAWSMENLAMEISYDDADIFLERFEWRTDERSRGRIEGVIRDYRGAGEYTVRIAMDDWLLTPHAMADAVVYGDAALRIVSPGLQYFLKMYQPIGRGGLDVQTRGRLGEWSAFPWSGTIRCDDISICYAKFPYRLDHMIGTLELPAETDELDIVLKTLRCRHGGIDWVIEGNAIKVGERWAYEVHLFSENMRFDDDLRAALSDHRQGIWQAFSPAGAARIDYRFGRSPDGEDTGLLLLELDGATAMYEHFPYPLENLTGTVQIESDRITLTNVVSRYDGDDRIIRMNGHVEAIESERPQFNMVIDANSVPIDATLRAALPERQKRFYEHFDVDALTDSVITVFPSEVERCPVDYIADVRIRDASMMYHAFPVPLTSVNVDAQLTADKILLKRMTALSGDGRLEVHGDIWPTSDRVSTPAFCLAVSAESLELQQEWLDGLPEEITRATARLRPRGPINLSATLNVNAPSALCEPFHVTVECLGNSLRPAGLPYALEGVTGRIDITSEEMRLENFRLPDLVLDADLQEILPTDAKKLYAALKPAGRVDVQIDRARFLRNDANEPQVDLAGDLIFKGCAFGDIGRVAGMEGVLSIDALCGSAGLLRASASLKADCMTVKGRTFSDVHADISYDPSAQRFVTRDFAAALYGGKVLGDAQAVQTPSGLSYELTAVFDSVEVGGIVAANRPADSGAPGSPSESRGCASGSIGLRGTFGHTESNLGRVQVGIRDMKLAPRSLLGKVLQTMQFTKPSDYLFSDMSVDAFLRGGRLMFQEVYMSGASNVLLGKGLVDLEQNAVDLEFRSYGSVLTSDPSFFETLARGLGAAVVRVKVSGSLDEPGIVTTPLPVLSGPMELLGR